MSQTLMTSSSVPLKQVEIELSSLCNAKCPGCRRTQLDEKGQDYVKKNLEVDLIKSRFHNLDLEGLFVKLCGVLGDPLMHPEWLSLSEWFCERGATVQISTNASLRPVSEWKRAGEISGLTGRLLFNFAVDGMSDTNHLYRVNTDFQKIMENIQAYRSTGGKGAWIFIEFDHNSHQIDEARRAADELGLDFYVRRATRNKANTWEVKGRKGDVQHKVQQETSKVHSGMGEYKKIIQAENKSLDPASIHCKFQHAGEFYLAADASVWPCCFLWDEIYAKNTSFRQVLDQYPEGWNSLHQQELTEIFASPFYQELESLWLPTSNSFQKRCYKSCGAKGSLRNSFSKD